MKALTSLRSTTSFGATLFGLVCAIAMPGCFVEPPVNQGPAPDLSGLVMEEFTASWCPPCKQLAPILDQLESNHPELKVIRIDVDENPDKANARGIDSMPQMVILQNDEEIGRLVGFRKYDAIVSYLAEVKSSNSPASATQN